MLEEAILPVETGEVEKKLEEEIITDTEWLLSFFEFAYVHR